MSRRRSKYVLVCGSIAALAWFVWRGSSHPPVYELTAEAPYAVRVDWEQAALDLQFSPETRYLLIVSSLGDAAGTHTVTLSAEPTTQPGPLPVERLREFRARAVGRHAGRSTASAPTDRDAGSAKSPRTFYLHVTEGRLDDPRQYARVTARQIAEGERVRVYLDGRQHPQELFPGVADEIVDALDNVVTPRLADALGSVRDIDGDGKFTVLLTPWLGRLEGGKTSLGGFVRAADFRQQLQPPFSNHCDMLYLNSNVRSGAHLQTLLMHEMTHAVCFSERLSPEPGAAPLPHEHDWLNEAIAHVAESSTGKSWTNLDYRISRFLTAPHTYPLVVDDYFQAGLWRNHGCRGGTYLFLQWCVDQFGEPLLTQLIHNPACGTANLAQATGVGFDELYRRWALSLWQSGRDAPVDVAQPSGDGMYRAVDPYGQVADWNLAGPRIVTWNVDGRKKKKSLTLAGTATAYIELEASGRAGHRRVHLSAPFGTNLQATLVRLSSDRPQISAECGWSSPGSSSGSDARGPFQLSVWVQSPTNCQIEAVSCERNYGETRRSFLFTDDELTARQTVVAADKGVRWVRYELPVQPDNDVSEPLLVKVVARDESGRRATAWATITEQSAFEPPLRMADAGGEETVTQ